MVFLELTFAVVSLGSLLKTLFRQAGKTCCSHCFVCQVLKFWRCDRVWWGRVWWGRVWWDSFPGPELPSLAVPSWRPPRSWPSQQPGEPAGKCLCSRSQVGVQSSSIFPTGCVSPSAFPAVLCRAELRVMWMEGGELVALPASCYSSS